MSIKKIAVIGLGNIGKAVAENLSKSGVNFIVSGRDLEETGKVAAHAAAQAEVSDITTAIKSADIIVLAIPFGEIAPFISTYSAELQGKLVIDPSNPIAPDENGGFKKIIDADKSAGEVNAAALPKGIKLAKALGTLGAATLSGAAYKTPANVLFYAADGKDVDADVEQLIKNNGFVPVKVGGLSQSARIEVFGDLHEFGALGKAVTAEEAKTAL